MTTIQHEVILHPDQPLMMLDTCGLDAQGVEITGPEGENT